MINITVKNQAGVNVDLTGISPSSGDANPAVYRYEVLSLPIALRPTFKVSATDNGPKTARKVRMSGVWPVSYTDTSTGLKGVQANIPFDCSFTLPTNVDSATIKDATVIQTNYMASAIIQAALLSGYAPTT